MTIDRHQKARHDLASTMAALAPEVGPWTAMFSPSHNEWLIVAAAPYPGNANHAIVRLGYWQVRSLLDGVFGPVAHDVVVEELKKQLAEQGKNND